MGNVLRRCIFRPSCLWCKRWQKLLDKVRENVEVGRGGWWSFTVIPRSWLETWWVNGQTLVKDGILLEAEAWEVSINSIFHIRVPQAQRVGTVARDNRERTICVACMGSLVLMYRCFLIQKPIPTMQLANLQPYIHHHYNRLSPFLLRVPPPNLVLLLVISCCLDCLLVGDCFGLCWKRNKDQFKRIGLCQNQNYLETLARTGGERVWRELPGSQLEWCRTWSLSTLSNTSLMMLPCACPWQKLYWEKRETCLKSRAGQDNILLPQLWTRIETKAMSLDETGGT